MNSATGSRWSDEQDRERQISLVPPSKDRASCLKFGQTHFIFPYSQVEADAEQASHGHLTSTHDHVPMIRSSRADSEARGEARRNRTSAEASGKRGSQCPRPGACPSLSAHIRYVASMRPDGHMREGAASYGRYQRINRAVLHRVRAKAGSSVYRLPPPRRARRGSPAGTDRRLHVGAAARHATRSHEPGRNESASATGKGLA